MKTQILKKQPVWAAGKEPDSIANIQGGFVDGEGNSFAVPVGFRGRACVRKDAAGNWEWMEADNG